MACSFKVFFFCSCDHTIRVIWGTLQGVTRKLQMPTNQYCKHTSCGAVNHLGVPNTFTEKWGLLRGHSVIGQSKGHFWEAFVTFVRVPVSNTYSRLHFLWKSMYLRSSTKCWHLRILGEKNLVYVKSIFQRNFSLYLILTEKRTGYPVSEAWAQKIKNVSCLHLYEVLYRNRLHPSARRVLSKMALE